MEERVKRHAALYLLIELVDANNGSIDINTDKVKKVFNDAEDTVRIEYSSGEVALLADADYETMNDAILKWKEDNPQKYEGIMEAISRKANK